MEFWQLRGDLHPKLVPFPLVLLLAGLLLDAVGLIRRGPQFHFAAKILSSAGTFFLLVAFTCGIYAEIWAGHPFSYRLSQAGSHIILTFGV